MKRKKIIGTLAISMAIIMTGCSAQANTQSAQITTQNVNTTTISQTNEITPLT